MSIVLIDSYLVKTIFLNGLNFITDDAFCNVKTVLRPFPAYEVLNRPERMRFFLRHTIITIITLYEQGRNTHTCEYRAIILFHNCLLPLPAGSFIVFP